MSSGDNDSLRSLQCAVTQALLPAGPVSALLQRSNEQFVDSALYSLAWIGRLDSASDALVPVAGAGIELTDLDDVSLDGSAPSPRPIARALDDGEVYVRRGLDDHSDGEDSAGPDGSPERDDPPEGDDLSEGDDLPEGDDHPVGDWQALVRDRGHRSLAVVPVRTDDECYGVLCLATDRRDAFDADECDALDDVVGTIAHAWQRSEIDTHGPASDSPPRSETVDPGPDPLEREFGTLERLFETLEDGIYALDAESRFAMVNDAFCELTGYDRDALLGEPASTVHSEAVEDRIAAAVEASSAADVDADPVGVALTTADGTSVSVEVQVSSFEFADGSNGHVGVVRDVTDRKRRERTLEQFQAITEAASDAIVAIDDAGVVRSANPAVETVFGHSPEDVLGEPLGVLMSDEVAAAHRAGFQRYLETGERTLDWSQVEVTGQHADGNDVPCSISFSEYEFDGDHYFAGIVRDVTERTRYERALAGLHDASRNLITAETESAVADRTLDAVTSVLDRDGVGIYLFDDVDNTLRPTAATAAFERRLGELRTYGPGDSAITWDAFLSGETVVHGDVRESDAVHPTDTPIRSGVWIPLGDHGVLAIVSDVVGGIDERTQRLADHLAATAEVALDRVAREASLRDHERELAERNRRLESVERVNAVIREIDQRLVRATTKADVERSVCDLLTGEDRYVFAWIGGVEDGDVHPRAWAGAGQGYLDDASLSIGPSDGEATDSEATDREPAVATATSGDVTVVSNVATGLGSAPWRVAALSRDLQSCIAVPLRYGETRYGVLAVYASEPDAFDDLTRSVLAELGETIGNAMHAVETERALLADSVVELDLAIPDANDPLVHLVRETGCTLTFEGIVPQAGDTARVFFTTSGATATALVTAVERSSSLESVTLLDRPEAERAGDADGGASDAASDGTNGGAVGGGSNGDASGGEEEHRFQVTVSGATIPSTLVECGAAVGSIEVTPEETRAVVELPHSIDVRTFVQRLERVHPDAELVARRDKRRDDPSGSDFTSEVAASLTDRQLEVVQTAYLSGYFEWPRERTGEEVAASLDITQSTFNGHLRAAERKLCTVLFDRLRETV